MYRRLLQQEMAKVEQNKDPLGVLREPDENEVILLPQEEQLYYDLSEDVEEIIRRDDAMRYSPIADEVVRMFTTRLDNAAPAIKA